MNKIPNKINILGKEFTILVRNRELDGIDQLASARDSTQSIWIEKECHHQVQEEALLHEILEMFNTLCELNLPHEKLSILGVLLYQVLSDNKLSFGDVKNE